MLEISFNKTCWKLVLIEHVGNYPPDESPQNNANNY